MHKVGTNSNLADIFTKPLVGEKFLVMRARAMGLNPHVPQKGAAPAADNRNAAQLARENQHGNEFSSDVTGDGPNDDDCDNLTPTTRPHPAARLATVRRACADGHATASKVEAGCNPADSLTKPLSGDVSRNAAQLALEHQHGAEFPSDITGDGPDDTSGRLSAIDSAGIIHHYYPPDTQQHRAWTRDSTGRVCDDEHPPPQTSDDSGSDASDSDSPGDTLTALDCADVLRHYRHDDPRQRRTWISAETTSGSRGCSLPDTTLDVSPATDTQVDARDSVAGATATAIPLVTTHPRLWALLATAETGHTPLDISPAYIQGAWPRTTMTSVMPPTKSHSESDHRTTRVWHDARRACSYGPIGLVARRRSRCLLICLSAAGEVAPAELF